MKIIMKFAYVVVISFLLGVMALVCIVYFGGNVDFEEENNISLTISKEEYLLSGELSNSQTSPIMSSPKDLQLYLCTREFYNYMPFEEVLDIGTFDFDNFDYVFSEGRPILRMKRLLWDECSSYESDSLTPLFFDVGDQLSRKVYIYKMKPKNKYRKTCS